MPQTAFDYTLSDAQSTQVVAVDPAKFDFSAYADYENILTEKCRNFLNAGSGVLVYRRMRVAEVFSYGCSDMKRSLALQLGALQKSMDYKADVPNFLEPWYGIGTVASAYGLDYTWNPGQAPALHYKYEQSADTLQPAVPVHETAIGKKTLEMIRYFLDQTKGRLPMSFCDVQSPLNIAANVVNSANFMMDMYMDAESVRKILDSIATLLIGFSEKQKTMIGDNLVFPGHGFASSRIFEGMGMSDDNIVMLPGDIYEDLVIPSFEKAGNAFNGPVLHSCGNWSGKIGSVKKIKGLKMIDAAFGPYTDPDPNPAESCRDGFANTEIIVNARIVGGVDVIEEQVRKLWTPGMKLIVVTYCQTPEEQSKAYEIITDICR